MTSLPASKEFDKDTKAKVKATKARLIREYTEAGFTLFPCVRSTKVPRHPQWQMTAYRQDLDASDMPESYGVLLTSDFVVLDIDPRRYAPGRNEFAELMTQLGLNDKRQETFIVKTGSGGFHIYFRKPPDAAVRGKVPNFPALDIKTAGGYVIAAGSIHTTGNLYEPERLDPRIIARIPDALLEYIRKPEHPAAGGSDIEDEPGAISQYIQHLLLVPPAIEGQNGDMHTWETACYGKDYGLSEDTTFRLMSDYFNPRCIPEWTETALLAKVHHAYTYGQNARGRYTASQDFAGVVAAEQATGVLPANDDGSFDDKPNWDWGIDKTGLKKLNPVLSNIIGFLRVNRITVNGKEIANPLKNMLRFNAFSREIEFTKLAPWHDMAFTHIQWEDSDAILMKSWLSDTQHFNAHTNLYHEAAIAVARKRQYHPIKDLAESMPVWDGVSRVDMLLNKYFGVCDNHYTKEISKCFLLAMWARIFEPGCQHDSMIVLEGKQGLGKTKGCQVLGWNWFSDTGIDPHSKDTFHCMQGKWLIEIAEMKFTRSTEIDAIKKFLTSKTDRARLAYERVPIDLPRQSVFIGTINTTPGVGYLRDETGNRRFWPVLCTRIDLPGLQRDRVQIFAESLQRYRSGETYYLTDPRVIAIAQAEADARVAIDMWEENIIDFLSTNQQGDDMFTTDHIMYAALSLAPAKRTMSDSRRVGIIMHKLGYEQKSFRQAGMNKKTWKLIKNRFEGLTGI
jgi:predicted P-loop ATPase